LFISWLSEIFEENLVVELIKLLSDIVDLLKLIYAPLITLVAGYLGMIYGLKQLRTQKKLEFIVRQLNEFYSPLLGYRKAIQAKIELISKVTDAASEAWKEKSEREPTPFLDHEKEYQPFKKIIEYNNEQLKDELLPLYRKILEIFRENYWLAEDETRRWYSEVSDFVELWDRWITDNIPAPVIAKLNHSEERLAPFYTELEERFNILRSKLTNIK
jgi:hypothetical protein